MKISFLKEMKEMNNRATDTITRKITTNTYPRFVTLSSFKKNSKIFSKTEKKIEKIHMNSEKLINSFGIKKSSGHLIIYGTIIFFGNLLITFQHFYYGKYLEEN